MDCSSYILCSTRVCFLAFSVDVNSCSNDMYNMCHAKVHSSHFKQSPLVVDPACFTRNLQI